MPFKPSTGPDTKPPASAGLFTLNFGAGKFSRWEGREWDNKASQMSGGELKHYRPGDEVELNVVELANNADRFTPVDVVSILQG